ncbi:hypothetical protein I317_04586 [Kwoniella heveanensis CBS 569]|nr:hypothetical protein I317_04586 [Kwoniella heveanensis CBS 569]
MSTQLPPNTLPDDGDTDMPFRPGFPARRFTGGAASSDGDDSGCETPMPRSDCESDPEAHESEPSSPSKGALITQEDIDEIRQPLVERLTALTVETIHTDALDRAQVTAREGLTAEEADQRIEDRHKALHASYADTLKAELTKLVLGKALPRFMRQRGLDYTPSSQIADVPQTAGSVAGTDTRMTGTIPVSWTNRSSSAHSPRHLPASDAAFHLLPGLFGQCGQEDDDIPRAIRQAAQDCFDKLSSVSLELVSTSLTGPGRGSPASATTSSFPSMTQVGTGKRRRLSNHFGAIASSSASEAASYHRNLEGGVSLADPDESTPTALGKRQKIHVETAETNAATTAGSAVSRETRASLASQRDDNVDI